MYHARILFFGLDGKIFFIIVDPPHSHVYAMTLFMVTSMFDFVIADQFMIN